MTKSTNKAVVQSSRDVFKGALVGLSSISFLNAGRCHIDRHLRNSFSVRSAWRFFKVGGQRNFFRVLRCLEQARFNQILSCYVKKNHKITRCDDILLPSLKCWSMIKIDVKSSQGLKENRQQVFKVKTGQPTNQLLPSSSCSDCRGSLI